MVPPTPQPTTAPSSPPDPGYGLRVPGLVISPYANHCYVDHQTLSFAAYNRFIEEDVLGGTRLDPQTDGRPDPRPEVRETVGPGDLSQDFTWGRTSFSDDGVPVIATPTPLPYGQAYPTPVPTWCAG